jgi:hypothetical protein
MVKFPENGGQWLSGIGVVLVWGSAEIAFTAIAVKNANVAFIMKAPSSEFKAELNRDDLRRQS